MWYAIEVRYSYFSIYKHGDPKPHATGLTRRQADSMIEQLNSGD